MGCRNNADHADVCRKKEDGKLPLGSRDDADHARGKDHHGLPCQAGFFGQRGREFGAAFVHSFTNSVYNWSRDAELVSFPAFVCFPGWSISRISVLFTARVKAISLSMISSAIAAFLQLV